jgi:hypothetical protein
MAKVTGPFMSIDASGTFANTITATKWKGRNVMRQKVTPANPRTGAQTGTRANFAGIVALWKLFVPTLTSAFETLAKQQNISAFNAFTGFNQKRLSQGKYIANTTAPTEEAPTANITALASTVSLKYVQLTWTDSMDPDAWAVMIYRKLAADPTGVTSELIAVVPRGIQLYNDGPLTAGTYHYSARAVHIEGGATVLTAAEIAIVI